MIAHKPGRALGAAAPARLTAVTAPVVHPDRPTSEGALTQ